MGHPHADSCKECGGVTAVIEEGWTELLVCLECEEPLGGGFA